MCIAPWGPRRSVRPQSCSALICGRRSAVLVIFGQQCMHVVQVSFVTAHHWGRGAAGRVRVPAMGSESTIVRGLIVREFFAYQVADSL